MRPHSGKVSSRLLPPLMLAIVASAAFGGTASAQVFGNGNGNGNANGNRNGNDSGNSATIGTGGDTTGGLANTPELDSVLLFASGLTGLGGYIALRRRARR